MWMDHTTYTVIGKDKGGDVYPARRSSVKLFNDIETEHLELDQDQACCSEHGHA